MELNKENNAVRLCGVMAGPPVFSHVSRGRRFYSFPLEVRRLSGTADRLNVLARPELLAQVEAQEREKLLVLGQLRSYNNRRGEGARLVLTVLARELTLCDGSDENAVALRGTLCKEPNLRVTPMGREICDLMLAVNRSYGRSDYLPCICWGSLARQASRWTVGERVELSGRFQSRSYVKLTETGPVERVAFEVSAAEVSLLASAEAIG